VLLYVIEVKAGRALSVQNSLTPTEQIIARLESVIPWLA